MDDKRQAKRAKRNEERDERNEDRFGFARSHSNGMVEKVSSSSGRCSVLGSIGFQVKSCFCVVRSSIGPLPSNGL